MRMRGQRLNAMCSQLLQENGGRLNRIKQDEVGFNGENSGYARAISQSFSKHLGMGVIDLQPRYVMVKGINAGCCQKPRLAHPAAKNLAYTARVSDGFPVR